MQYSIEKPLEESKNIVKNIKNQEYENKILIIYGIGLGYLVDEAANKIKNSSIILYEPNIDILRFVFEIASIDAISKGNVYLAANKEELKNIVKKLANSDTDISVSFLNSYKNLFKPDIENVLNTAIRTVGEICAKKNIMKKIFLPFLIYFQI